MTKKTESLTPILDDEDKYSDFRKVQQLWLERQPEWDTIANIKWEDLHEDIHRRYYKERGEQVEIRTMAKWNAIPKDQQRDLISMVNNTIEALDSMMHVMYDLQRPIPESIRKIACKEFEW